MNCRPVDKEQIFNLAAEAQDSNQQRQLLDELCGDDLRLRAEIEDLLSCDGKLGDFLDLKPGSSSKLAEEIKEL